MQMKMVSLIDQNQDLSLLISHIIVTSGIIELTSPKGNQNKEEETVAKHNGLQAYGTLRNEDAIILVIL